MAGDVITEIKKHLNMFNKRKMLAVVPVMLILAIGVGFILLGPMSGTAQGVRAQQSPPDRIAGYKVLGIRDSSNTACHTKDVTLFVLQATEGSAEALMSSTRFKHADIKRSLVDEGYPADSEILMAGPTTTRSQETQSRHDWNRLRGERGCIRFGGNEGQGGESD